MIFPQQILLLGAVVVVGVLHTMVPDHWVPITLIAREKKWSRNETARAAFQAGFGHVVTTLLIAVVVWVAGVAIATQYGNIVDDISSLALIGFGLWIAIGAWREMHHEHGHYHGDIYHPHDHHEDDHSHSHDSKRTALLLILGSSPMVEGIPAFFAASKYGIGLLIPMAILFAASTIATYVVLCVYCQQILQNIKFAAFEKYGEVLSGAFIAILGVVFLVYPIMRHDARLTVTLWQTASSTTQESLPNLAARLAACKAFPNDSTQNVVETTRLFINTPKDIFPDKDISSDFETVRGNATAGYVSNGGLPGNAYEATSECWSTYVDFEGNGEVDLKIESTLRDVPDYFVRFVVGPTQ